jgi:hypothetical protein
MMTFPTEWKVNKFMFQTTNQPYSIYHWGYTPFTKWNANQDPIPNPLRNPNSMGNSREIAILGGFSTCVDA